MSYLPSQQRDISVTTTGILVGLAGDCGFVSLPPDIVPYVVSGMWGYRTNAGNSLSPTLQLRTAAGGGGANLLAGTAFPNMTSGKCAFVGANTSVTSAIWETGLWLRQASSDPATGQMYFTILFDKVGL